MVRLFRVSPLAHLRVVEMSRFVSDINQPSLPLFFCLFLSYGHFTCILFHKFSRQLSAFSLCSPSLISALLVNYISLSKSLPKWFQRPGVFGVRCDPCRGRKGSWKMRYPLVVACWGQHISLALTSLRRMVGLSRPNQSAGRVEL